MSSWEDRFDAVVRETERNLAHLRKKSTPEKLHKRYNEEKTKSASKYDNYLAVGISPVDSYKPSNSPNRTEFWKQGDELDKLRKQVTLLQQSNTQYEQEAKSLKHQVSLLKKQTISNRKREPSAVSSTSLEIFKREIWDEMRSLKAEVAGGSSAGSSSEKEVTALRKDLDSSRLKQAQDFQELKNDVDNMRNRMMKVELMVKSVVTDCKECLRKCQRLGSEASHFSETVRLQHRSVSSQLQSVSDHCAHLPVLRSSLSDLDGRLSSLERTANSTPHRVDSITPASLRDSTGTRGSSYFPDQLRQTKNKALPRDDNNLSFVSDDLSLLSGVEDTVDISTSSTYKQDKNISLSESLGRGADHLSLISDLALSDDDDFNLLSS